MARTDLLFVFPKYSNGRCFEGFDYHLGCALVRSALERRGIATDQFVHPGHRTLRQTVLAMLERRPGVIGFSCYDINYYYIKLVCEQIRKQDPDVLLICGGPAATFSDRHILSDCAAIDVCVRSYAELTTGLLWDWFIGDRAIDTVPGITWRERGIIRRTPTLSVSEALGLEGEYQDAGVDHMSALDILPDPYTSGMIPPGRVTDIGIMTSRGCTFPCVYCNFAAMSRRTVHYHSVERVIEVLRFLDNALARPDGGVTVVSINDDNFSLNRRRLETLLKRMAVEKFANLRFWAEMRAETLRESTFPLLVRAGFTALHFGLESGVPEILARARKVRLAGGERDGYRKEKLFLDRIRWAVEGARAVGLKVNLSIILGLPGESEEQGKATIAFVDTLGADGYAHNYLNVLAGTELARSHADFDIEVRPIPGKSLPTRTVHAYDVFQVGMLDNELVWSSPERAELQRVAILLSGTGMPDLLQLLRAQLTGSYCDTPSKDTDEVVPVIALYDSGADADVLDWLAAEFPLAASLWVVHDEEVSHAGFEQVLAEHRVPVLFANTLRRTKAATWRINELSPSAPATNTRRLHSLGWRDATSRQHSASVRSGFSTARDSILVELTDKADVLALAEWAENAASEGSWRLDRDTITSRWIIADGCRWCVAECPASEGRRWVVDRKGGIRPCPEGLQVGRAGDSLETLRAHASALLAREREHRGCTSCEIHNVCSACPAPHPFNADDYCAIRRANPIIGQVVESLMLMRKLAFAGAVAEGSGDWQVYSLARLGQGSITENGQRFPLAECLLVVIQGTPQSVLYHARANIFATLEREQATLLHMLLRAAH